MTNQFPPLDGNNMSHDRIRIELFRGNAIRIDNWMGTESGARKFIDEIMDGMITYDLQYDTSGRWPGFTVRRSEKSDA